MPGPAPPCPAAAAPLRAPAPAPPIAGAEPARVSTRGRGAGPAPGASPRSPGGGRPGGGGRGAARLGTSRRRRRRRSVLSRGGRRQPRPSRPAVPGWGGAGAGAGRPAPRQAPRPAPRPAPVPRGKFSSSRWLPTPAGAAGRASRQRRAGPPARLVPRLFGSGSCPGGGTSPPGPGARGGIWKLFQVLCLPRRSNFWLGGLVLVGGGFFFLFFFFVILGEQRRLILHALGEGASCVSWLALFNQTVIGINL